MKFILTIRVTKRELPGKQFAIARRPNVDIPSGLNIFFEIEDLSIHALYGFDKDETTAWAAVDGGYSLIADGWWFFGIELEAP